HRWSASLTAIATLVLAVYAVAAFHYTLVPLHRLAATDDELARKQTEVLRAQERLDAVYAQVRAYTISSFVFRIVPKCTGLLDPPEVPQFAEALKDPTGKALKDLKAKTPSWRRHLTFDVRKCLMEPVGAGSNLEQLQEADRQLFARDWGRAVED